MEHRFCLMTLVCALYAIAPAHAQYPTKAIRLIVPTTPGGVADISARIVGQGLSESLGKQVIVDNRAGAGGNISAELAAKSAPLVSLIGLPASAALRNAGTGPRGGSSVTSGGP